MNLEIKTLDNGIVAIEMIGRLDLQGGLDIEAQFRKHSETEKAGILVDMSNVDFISSNGMRLLISNAKSLSKQGGKMVLYNPVNLVKSALETAGFNQLIPIHDDYQSACADLLEALSADSS